MRATVSMTPKPLHTISTGAICSSALAAAVLISSCTCIRPLASLASPLACSEIIVSIDVKRKDEALLQPSTSQPTLFLTARSTSLRIPFASKAVPTEGLSFPFEVNLGGSVSDILMRSDAYPELEKVLTNGAPVIVSGRLDLDGDPNTRDGEDLVGRTEVGGACLSKEEAPRKAKLVLEGRGAFGKFLTQRK